MLGLIGEYEVAMDAKGRFMVPAGFKKLLPEDGDMRFVLSRGMERCITLYTMDGWSKLMEKLNKLNDLNLSVQKLKRLLLNGASIIDADTAGRLLIPKPLQEFAGLSKELVFSGQINKVEIWDKQTYYDYTLKGREDLSDLATEVFGSEILDPFS